jgi:catechol 2,3-dioxygenase-like lactoylglutathione lyase family enzyme
MLSVRGIDAVMIYAADPAALARWYARTLGIAADRSAADGNFYADVVDSATGHVVHFGIYPSPDPPAPGRPTTMINYRVDDFDAALEELRRMEVRIVRQVDEGYGRFAYVDDPEGNPVEIWAARAR